MTLLDKHLGIQQNWKYHNFIRNFKTTLGKTSPNKYEKLNEGKTRWLKNIVVNIHTLASLLP